jgi:hypothetical protein
LLGRSRRRTQGHSGGRPCMGDTRRRVVEEAFVDSGCAWEWVSQFYKSCPIFQVSLYLKAEKSDKIPFEAGNSRCPSYGLGST